MTGIRTRKKKSISDESPERAQAMREIWKKATKKYVLAHPDRIAQYRVDHPEMIREKQKRSNIKSRSTPGGRLNDSISAAVGRGLRGTKAGRPWESLVGYTVDQLKRHIEKLFKPGMTWNNYGAVWHIDHKTPIVAFNFQTPEDIDFRRCWALKNLQPLEALMNMKKKAKIDRPFQPSLTLAA